MAQKSEIEWTDATWNPVTGCTKVGAGCDNCYAERFAERWRGTKDHPFEMGFDLTLRPHRLKDPLSWKKPRFIFVNSMSDLFHKDIPKEFIDQVFNTMEQADHHIFQVLTKRSSLMRNYINDRYTGGSCPEHIWLGVSIENKEQLGRLEHLRECSVPIRFISFEPLLGAIGKVNMTGISWAIIGGESGPRARPMDEKWVLDLKDSCLSQNVEFFFKQWGGARPKTNGRLLEGVEWDGIPANHLSKAIAS